jgi:hypothetical protein
MNSNETIKANIRTIGELVDALSTLPREMIFIDFFDESKNKDGKIMNKASYKGVGFTVGKGSNNHIYNKEYALLERTVEYTLI